MESSKIHSLSEEPLEELLLSLEAREESVKLCVKTQVGDAQIHVDRGRLALAVFGAQLGVDALKTLLSYKEGTYTILRVAPEMSDLGEHAQLRTLIRDKERTSTRLSASGQRPQLRVSSSLARTTTKLPSGLSPAELRSLAAVDGRTTILNIVRKSADPPEEALQALRELVRRGLAMEVKAISMSPTLSMGTGRTSSSSPPAGQDDFAGAHSAADNSSDYSAADNSSDYSAADSPAYNSPAYNSPAYNSPGLFPEGLAPMEDPVPEGPIPKDPGNVATTWEGGDASGKDMQLTKKSTGRWAKSPHRRPPLDFTGYSSVPPPALAAEQVTLPRSLQTPADRELHPQNHSEEGSPVAREDVTRTVERVAPEAEPNPKEPTFRLSPLGALGALESVKRHDTPTALSTATVRPEREFPATNYELRDSEIPVPSTRLDPETLEQLDVLNAALKSSRHPRPPSDKPSSPFSRSPSSEVGPPSSLGFGLSMGQVPSPGSVPNPQDLPGPAEPEDNSGLPRVGRYEVLARLKRGGMGSVYMCRLSGAAGFRRLFAMKVLHGHLAEQGPSLEAFFHEARVLGELHHPNIVGIADVGTPQEPYIVMDYVEGGSLSELYRATAKGRDPAVVISVILDALAGLSYAHTAQDEHGEPLELVHFDVTPHNLLVGIDGSCRLTDFGIARTRKEGGDSQLVQGKPGYLAPERLRHEQADHRADVFSIGVALYAGLTGVEPFRGNTQEESAQLILKGQLNPPSEVGFRPPPALDWVCMKALALDLNSRFTSAEEMALQLRRIAERENLIAKTSEVGKWVRRSLGPTLAARRAASMRGTGHTEPPPRVNVYPSTLPPKVEESRVPSDAPSAAEITGPMDAPASEAFNENTEIIESSGQPRRSSFSKYATFLAVTIAVTVAAWAVVHPASFSRFFEFKVPGGSQGASDIHSEGQVGPSRQPTNPPRKTGEEIEIDDEGKVILPPIQPGGQ